MIPVMATSWREHGSVVAECWKKRDYNTFRKLYPTCPTCGNLPVWTPERLEVGTITIDSAITCYCETLERLCNTRQRTWESYFDRRATLSTIQPIDVPPGAAKITRENLAGIKRLFSNPAQWIYISGGTGTAKSYILFALRRYYGSYAHYITASDFNQKLMDTTKSGEAGDFINSLVTVPILIVDDFGAQHDSKTDYGLNILFHIVDQRYSGGLLAPVWMSSNIKLEYLLDYPSDNAKRLASRVADSDLMRLYHFTQSDYRLLSTKEDAGLND